MYIPVLVTLLDLQYMENVLKGHFMGEKLWGFNVEHNTRFN